MSKNDQHTPMSDFVNKYKTPFMILRRYIHKNASASSSCICSNSGNKEQWNSTEGPRAVFTGNQFTK